MDTNNPNTPAETQTFEQRVNAALDSATADDNGKLTFADDVDEGVRFAAMAEKRRRDTQAAFSKSQTSLKALEAENNTLAGMLQKELTSLITPEQREELDELKAEDPDKWRARLNELETEQAQALEDKRAEARQRGEQESELERRSRLLEEYNEQYPDFKLTDEVIDEELPPKYKKQLERGEISFEQFLSSAAEFLGAPKTVGKGEEAPNSPSLSRAGGTSEPSTEAQQASSSESYAKEVY